MKDEIINLIKSISQQKPIYNRRYNDKSASSIILESPNSLMDFEKKTILNSFYSNGFCLIKFKKASSQGEINVKLISSFLNLGDPYIPEYFENYHGNKIVTKSGINKITSLNQEKFEQHVAFSSTNSQGLHVDGTTAPIGFIKTSILYCDKPASIGGENTIFNSVAAFTNMFEEDVDSILPLLNEYALIRKHSTFGSKPYYGPVFKLDGNQILNRFSIDNTSYWEEGFEKIENLQKSFEKLKSYTLNKLFSLKLKLDGNSALILSNDKISHGRESFVDQDGFRTMYRGLFLNEPI